MKSNWLSHSYQRAEFSTSLYLFSLFSRRTGRRAAPGYRLVRCTSRRLLHECRWNPVKLWKAQLLRRFSNTQKGEPSSARPSHACEVSITVQDGNFLTLKLFLHLILVLSLFVFWAFIRQFWQFTYIKHFGSFKAVLLFFPIFMIFFPFFNCCSQSCQSPLRQADIINQETL